MNWTGYADVLRRRWRVICLAVLLVVGIALLVTQLQDKRYTSSVRLLVSGSSPGTANESASRDLAAERARLFGQIATTEAVVAAAVQSADGTVPADVAAAHVSVRTNASGGEPFLTVEVTADDPDAAQAVAKAYPLILPGQLARLNELPAVNGALLSVVKPAQRPTHPSEPRPLLNIGIGIGVGLLLGIVAVALREALGTGLKDVRQIRQLSRGKVLGVVPRQFDDERLAVASRPQSPRTAGYGQVRAELDAGPGPRSFVVTSPHRGEGRSTVAANLALLYGRAGLRVALVDTDLRRPSLAASFNLASESGLADVLTGRAELSDVLQQVPGEQVSVLAGGESVADPKDVLAWPAMAEVLRTLIAHFDVVIVDAPPVLAGSEALLLGALTDGALIVARPGRTTRPALRRTLAAIQRAPAHLLGIVVNAAEPTAAHAAEGSAPPSTPASAERVTPELDHLDPTYPPHSTTERKRRARRA